ncbi:MAG: GntR family transcriptional regulator [Bacteroidales bacterium]|nr:GntR family transcriptional regulator [Bacteroidales bacterium]
MTESIPQYRQLYEVLRKQIVEGIYRQGDLLPSESALCRQYKITRPTVRHALDALLNEGMIRKHQGKGSIVTGPANGIGILSISGTTSALGMHNLRTHILSKPSILKWPEPFMFPLDEEVRASGCIYLERLRLVDDRPIFYDLNYLPNINLPRFTSRKFEEQSLFDILRRAYRIEVKSGEQRIRAVRADNNIHGYLNVPVGYPVLHLQRKLNTNRPGYYFFSSIHCNTDAYALYGTF